MVSDTVRVLHVDDETDFADLTKTFLEREDGRISVETAHSPDEGLCCLDGSDFDCVVSDYDMPGRNGIEFLREVRAEFPYPPVYSVYREGVRRGRQRRDFGRCDRLSTKRGRY